MKLITYLLVGVLAVSAATIEITVKNNAGAVISSATISIDAATIQAVKEWQAAQISMPAQPRIEAVTEKGPDGKDVTRAAIEAKPAVLRFPNDKALWGELFGRMLQTNSILKEYHPGVKAQREVAKAAAQLAVELEQGAIK